MRMKISFMVLEIWLLGCGKVFEIFLKGVCTIPVLKVSKLLEFLLYQNSKVFFSCLATLECLIDNPPLVEQSIQANIVIKTSSFN